MTEGNDITRREAIARTALFVGGTLAAAHLAGVESPAWAAAAAQQVALLRVMDGESFPPERVLAKAEPLNTERAKMRDSLARQSSTSTTISDPTRASADAGANETARRELEQGWFFRRMKEL